MVLWDKLGRVSDYLRRLRLSLGPDSYFHYKRERKYERKRAADDAHERVKDSAERKRDESERDVREGEYQKRYASEREREIAREPSERTDEVEPDAS
jgi:hypothetical protein